MTIAAGKTRQVSFKLQMPDQAFRGQVMGGLQVVRESDQESGSITDRYSVAVPVVIRQTKNQLKGQVNLVKASYRLENGVGVINLKTQNTAPWVLPSVQVTGNVIRRSDNEVVTTLKKREMALAPNSQFSLPVQVKKALAAGDYTLHYTAQASATNQVWHFNKDFTVKANQVTQNSQTPGTWWRENWLWLTGLVIVAIAAGLKLANMKKRREK
ncbi:DUF3324 domain-containing protein [Secundilactobacillus oryzae]|uniref:DUF3324 domain-containing protein n=1 Tax=Secundilactobacillus oryzae TaxID=1202668 RepID=UPI0034E23B5C